MPMATYERSFLFLMALDVSGNWQAGDDLRIITALSLPFGSFTLDCVQNCCGQLEEMSPEAVLEVLSLIHI